jgi:ABC-type antimicrobial peptide transport system permease subunit
LLLAAVGVYGALAFSVGRRTREIGIRMALGANGVLPLVLRQGLLLLGTGIALGTLLALAATRLLASLLYGVRPIDPPTFAGAGLVPLAAAAAANLVPARRAARVDPMVALRVS